MGGTGHPPRSLGVLGPEEWEKDMSSLRGLSEGLLEEVTPGVRHEGIERVVQVKRVKEGHSTQAQRWERLVYLGSFKCFSGWSMGQIWRGKQGLWRRWGGVRLLWLLKKMRGWDGRAGLGHSQTPLVRGCLMDWSSGPQESTLGRE